MDPFAIRAAKDSLATLVTIARPNPDRVHFTYQDMNAIHSIALAAASSLAAFAAPSPFASASAAPAHYASVQHDNIVEVATAAGSFKTLLAAAKAADLVKPLVGKGPLTVLAPTDEAFAKLGKDAIKDLLRPENKAALANILKYHVIAGEVTAADALKAKSAATLNGQKVSFALDGGRLRINGEVNVIGNDVMASNGVIHIIDQVLIPEALKPEGRLVIGFFSEKPGAQLARYLGVDPNDCLLVTEITKDSEAAKAGLRAYDLILSINGKTANQNVIRSEKDRVGYAGGVKLDILRRGKKMTIDSKVGVSND